MNTTFFTRYRDGAHNLFRVAVGLLFWQHGARKLFGWFGGTQVETLFSQMGLAGVLEFFGGLLIVVGLLTRPVALVLAAEMVVAYVQAHAPQGLMPIQNGGERALLYLVGFLLLATLGAGTLSLDAKTGSEEPSSAGAGEGPGASGGSAAGTGSGPIASGGGL